MLELTIKAHDLEGIIEECRGILNGTVNVHGQVEGGIDNPSPRPEPSTEEPEKPAGKAAKKKAAKKKASKKTAAKKEEEPAQEDQPEVSLEDMREIAKKVSTTEGLGMDELKAVIDECGGENLSSIPADQRSTFMERCQDMLNLA